MVAATVFFALAAALAAAAWTLWPLVDKTPAPILVEDDKLVDLIARKDAVVTALRDLEFDYHVGKLNEEDYRRYEQRLRRQAVVYMQQIEEMAPSSTEMDAGIEAEITRLRRIRDSGEPIAATPYVPAQKPVPAMTMTTVRTPSPAANPVPGAQPLSGATLAQAQDAAPSNGAPARFCTNCGQPLQPQHKFCSNCGMPVEGVQ